MTIWRLSVRDISDLDPTDAAKLAEEAPVVKLVNYILREAITKKASDIHIEPYEKVLRVRLRIDGAFTRS